MSQDNLQINYHAFLGEIKEAYDPIITKMRNQDPKGWRGQAWLGPLKTLKSVFKSTGFLLKIQWGSLPFIGPLIGFMGVRFLNLPIWLMVLAAVLILFTIYFILVVRYTGKMVVYSNPEFHVGAFKAKRPGDYQIWAPAIRLRENFNGLYDFVNVLLYNPEMAAEIRSLLELAQEQKEEMRVTTDIFETERKYLLEEIEKNERAVIYLVDMLKASTKSVYRIVNDCMNFQELDFVCAYTIYERRDNKLYKIVDKGTTGRSPMEIELTEENAKVFGAVDVALHPADGMKYNNPYPGRTVVSSPMNMLNGSQWVWNFHFDDSDMRALFLTLSSDIIDIREVYRLVHAFCLILQKSILSGEERPLNGQSSNRAHTKEG
ncbi:MAG: hypothetical protein ACE3L7_14610 [Candidatus Pristimantibacillus sp.]